MNITKEEVQQVLDALAPLSNAHFPDERMCLTDNDVDAAGVAITLLQSKLAEPRCKDHPDAPHGFDRNASHNEGRYVCECEGWEPEKDDAEPVACLVELQAENVKLRSALEIAVRQNDCDMLMTGDELRAARAALDNK